MSGRASPAAAAAVEAMLQADAAATSRGRRRRRRLRPDGIARARGDGSMAAAAAAMPAARRQTAWLLLAGMQRSLFGTDGLAGNSGGGSMRGEFDLFGIYLPPLCSPASLPGRLTLSAVPRTQPGRLLPFGLASAAGQSRTLRPGPGRHRRSGSPRSCRTCAACCRHEGGSRRCAACSSPCSVGRRRRCCIGWRMWDYYMEEPWTRDGILRADVVGVAADVSGLVVEVYVHDTQAVRQGRRAVPHRSDRFTLALREANGGRRAEATRRSRRPTARPSGC